MKRMMILTGITGLPVLRLMSLKRLKVRLQGLKVKNIEWSIHLFRG